MKKFLVVAVDGDSDIVSYVGNDKNRLAEDMLQDFPSPVRFIHVLEITLPGAVTKANDISKVPVTKITAKF